MKRYQVVGTSTVVVNGSHPPGDEFSADMSVLTEAFLTQIGAIVEVVEPEPVVMPEPESEPDNGGDAPAIHPELDFGDDEKEEQ